MIIQKHGNGRTSLSALCLCAKYHRLISPKTVFFIFRVSNTCGVILFLSFDFVAFVLSVFAVWLGFLFAGGGFLARQRLGG